MLKINGLKKSFKDFNVLHEVNMLAEPGKIYGLVGSNGCGKTTLLKHIMKIYRQDAGYIYYNGDAVEENSGIIKNFYFVQDNLYFPYQFTLNKLYDYESIMYDNISREKFDKLTAFFNVDPDKVLTKMSKGQKKQAAFIMAAAVQPEVLLLDEIVDGLDAVVKRKFWNVLIQEVIDRNMIVIIASHDLKELDNICDRIGIMHQGTIIREENLDRLKEQIKRVQFAVEGDAELLDCQSVNVLNTARMGSVHTCTITGDVDSFRKYLDDRYKLLLFDELNVTLEEIFITELGGAGYGTEDIEL